MRFPFLLPLSMLILICSGQARAQQPAQLGPALTQAMAGMRAAQTALEALQRDPAAARAAASDQSVKAALAALQQQIASLTEAARSLMQPGAPAAPDALAACRASNAKLLALGQEILHLYETQSFRSLLVRSYEPLIGIYRVKLENLVQDYDDKLLDQALPPQPKTAPAP